MNESATEDPAVTENLIASPKKNEDSTSSQDISMEIESADDELLSASVLESKNIVHTKCCVHECKTNLEVLSNITFVTFPKDPSRFEEWAKAINQPDLNADDNVPPSSILICSNHFPKNMWLNSDSKLKKLCKSAVPQLSISNPSSENDEDAAIKSVSTRKSGLSIKSKSGGLKVKKVSTLLTESALKDCSSSSKWGTALQRKQALATTDKEKKLLAENANLKSELDKNMDYILNQKSHYEGIVSKEKEKSLKLQNKLSQLEAENRKTTKNYDAQLTMQKSKASKSEANVKELSEKLKKSVSSANEFERKFNESHSVMTALRTANDNLISRVNEMADNSPPPPPENILQGENFKVFLNGYLKEHKLMKEQIEILTQELHDTKTSEGQKSVLLRLASQHLNHGQFTWLQAQLADVADYNSYPEHFKEFCISLYQVSDAAYKICMKSFGLAPIWCVNQWNKDPKTDVSSVNSMINSLFEEFKPLPKHLKVQTNVLCEKAIDDLIGINGRLVINKIKLNKRSTKKRKITNDSDTEPEDDDRDEGKLSDEDEELYYSSSDEEINIKDPLRQTANGRSETQGSAFQSKRPEPLTQAGPSQSSTQPDFDFMLDETSQQMGSSMPILVPDSPIVPMVGMNHNRKKLPEISIPSTSKVIFRVAET